MFNKLRKKIQAIPDRKRYIDFIAALFALPVMVTVLVINIGNLQKEDTQNQNKSQNPQTIVIETTPQKEAEAQNLETCKKRVGPIEIASPVEGQQVSSNPINIFINYDDSEYCSVVWSYRLNGGAWSEYSSSSIAIYNPPSGEISLDLRVQSTASQDSTQLNRTFTHTGSSTNEPSPTIEDPTPVQSD